VRSNLLLTLHFLTCSFTPTYLSRRVLCHSCESVSTLCADRRDGFSDLLTFSFTQYSREFEKGAFSRKAVHYVREAFVFLLLCLESLISLFGEGYSPSSAHGPIFQYTAVCNNLFKLNFQEKDGTFAPASPKLDQYFSRHSSFFGSHGFWVERMRA